MHHRDYTLTLDSDRTSLGTGAPGSNGACSTSSPTTDSTTFDIADRITNSGYAYDYFGRTRTVPAIDTNQPGGSALTVRYFADDMVASESQNYPTSGSSTYSKTFTLDPSERISARSTPPRVSTSGKRPTITRMTRTRRPGRRQTRPDASTGWTNTWTRNVLGPTEFLD